MAKATIVMTRLALILGATGLFVLGAIVALGGARLFFHPSDPRDAMETVAALQDWRLTCPPRTMKKGVCLIQSGIVQKGTNNMLAELSVTQKDNADMMTIVTPLGVFIPTGVRFAVGNGAAKTVAFKTCLQLGCVATLPMDSALETALAHNTGGQITLVTADGRSVPMNFSLRGYNDALADRKIDMDARK